MLIHIFLLSTFLSGPQSLLRRQNPNINEFVMLFQDGWWHLTLGYKCFLSFCSINEFWDTDWWLHWRAVMQTIFYCTWLFFHSVFSTTMSRKKKHIRINIPSDIAMSFFRILTLTVKKKVILMQIFHTCLLSKRAVSGQVVKSIK